MAFNATTINGHTFSWTSIELAKGGFKPHIQALNYTMNRTVGEVRGRGGQIINTTRGEFSFTGSMTFLLEDWYELIRSQGQGFAEKFHDWSVSFSERNNSRVITDRLIRCQFGNVTRDHAPGTDALVVAVDLSIIRVQYDGLSPFYEAA